MNVLKKIIKVFSQIVINVLLCTVVSSCLPTHNPYQPKQECLSSVIASCKQKGWKFATTNPDCKRAADVGIYGLSCEQLNACRAAEQQAQAKR